MFEPDRNVDYIDLAGFAVHQMSIGCIGPRDYNSTDSDYDTDVDFLDFSILFSYQPYIDCFCVAKYDYIFCSART